MSLTKDHAEKIRKKLKGTIDTSTKAHDIVTIEVDGVLVATFGIRRGSNRNQGHGHIPALLNLRPNQAMRLANCPMSRDEWLELMREKGLIPGGDGDGDGGEDGGPRRSQPSGRTKPFACR
jgi:hypothetical protein